MRISDYLIYMVLGMAVVFFALILLMVIIKIIVKLTDDKKTETAQKEQIETETVEEKSRLADGTAGDIKLYDTDPRDAAMIMAIVADETGIPLNELRFISIREVEKA